MKRGERLPLGPRLTGMSETKAAPRSGRWLHSAVAVPRAPTLQVLWSAFPIKTLLTSQHSGPGQKNWLNLGTLILQFWTPRSSSPVRLDNTYLEGGRPRLRQSPGLALSHTGCVTFCKFPTSQNTVAFALGLLKFKRGSHKMQGVPPSPQQGTHLFPRCPLHPRGCQPARDHLQETLSAQRGTELTQRGGGVGDAQDPSWRSCSAGRKSQTSP